MHHGRRRRATSQKWINVLSRKYGPGHTSMVLAPTAPSPGSENMSIEPSSLLQHTRYSGTNALQCSHMDLVDQYEQEPAAFLRLRPRVKLWDVQQKICTFLAARARDANKLGCTGALVCETFGSGKTLAIWSYILQTIQERVASGGTRFNGEPYLIIVPSGLYLQWLDQFTRFMPANALNIVCITADDQANASHAILDADTTYLTQCIDVVLTTYSAIEYAARDETLATLSDRGLFSICWSALIADEATALINAGTSIFAACSAFMTRQRVFISATPARNNLVELDTAIRFVGGQVSPSTRARVLEKLMLRSGPSGNSTQPRGTVGARQTITRKIAWLRFRPGGVEDKLYKRLTAWYCESALLPRLLFLRMACTTPVMLLSSADRAALPSERRPSTKIAALIHFIRRHIPVHQKILVFSQWVVALREVQHHLSRADLTSEVIEGRTPPAERFEIQRRFLEQDTPRILLLNYHVAANGLNLQRANWVLLLERWWNKSVESQAIGRVDRLDQREPINVVSFCMAGTEDASVIKIQNRKQRDIDMAIDNK